MKNIKNISLSLILLFVMGNIESAAVPKQKSRSKAIIGWIAAAAITTTALIWLKYRMKHAAAATRKRDAAYQQKYQNEKRVWHARIVEKFKEQEELALKSLDPTSATAIKVATVISDDDCIEIKRLYDAFYTFYVEQGPPRYIVIGDEESRYQTKVRQYFNDLRIKIGLGALQPAPTDAPLAAEEIRWIIQLNHYLSHKKDVLNAIEAARQTYQEEGSILSRAQQRIESFKQQEILALKSEDLLTSFAAMKVAVVAYETSDYQKMKHLYDTFYALSVKQGPPPYYSLDESKTYYTMVWQTFNELRSMLGWAPLLPATEDQPLSEENIRWIIKSNYCLSHKENVLNANGISEAEIPELRKKWSGLLKLSHN